MNTGTFLGYRNDKGEEMHCAHAKCISPEMCLKGCKCPVAKSTPPMSDDLIRELRHPFANKLLCTKAADEIERLRRQLAEWQQAASVEAGLRREFLARAEKAEAERDDALKQLENDQWQPIETAPKDGTPMLLCRWNRSDQDVLPVTSGFWSRIGDHWFSEMSGHKCNPTHWKPLGTPPHLTDDQRVSK